MSNLIPRNNLISKKNISKNISIININNNYLNRSNSKEI